MMGLTERQLEVLAFIEQHIAEHGLSPSYQQIAEGLGLQSKSGIHRMVTCLRERGHIDFLPDRARSIRLVNPPDPLIVRWLPADLEAKLQRYCAEHGEVAADVLADAVSLHLDHMDAEHERE